MLRLVLVCLYLSPLLAQENLCSDLGMLDRLMEVTKKNLSNQEGLRNCYLRYDALREQFMANQSSETDQKELVQLAYDVLRQIQEQNLELYFDPSVLSELSMFSQIAIKRRYVVQ